MPMFAGNRMTTEQFKNLSSIVRQMRDVVKRSIDEITELGERALSVFVENEEMSSKNPLPKVAIEKRLLNKTELARRLGVSVRTVNNLQNDGLPSVKLRKRVLFDYEKVLTWTEEREIGESRKNKLRVVK
ncbi:MAG TPA: helix-turn-helix domain-containing protein [Pyrinomonadaceae bacterium]|jgi:excisionase family DNA binding protein